MKLPKGYTLIKTEELEDRIQRNWRQGFDEGHENAEDRIDELTKSVKRKNKEIANLKENVDELETKVEVYEEERDDVRDIVKQKILLDDRSAALDARKEALDIQAADIKDRTSKLESKEEGRYKVGYADGVADGVRKITEITQQDRDNAMKIAMVAASAHTPVANMKEAMDAGHQLTEGTKSS